MNKVTKSLPQAIKIIVGLNGKDVVNDILLVNIMSDVVDLEDSAAVKTILKDILAMGYGKQLLAINTESDDLNFKIKAFTKSISNHQGYKEVLVRYVLYSLAYGIGLINRIPRIKSTLEPNENLSIQSTLADQSSVEESLDLEPKKQIPFWMAAVFAIFLLLGIGQFLRYMASSEDREQFDSRVFTGNSFMSSGDYVNAVESYKEAYNGYNGMSSGSYKEDALGKIDAVADKLIKEGENSNKSLLQAQMVMESELQLNLNDEDKTRIKTKMSELENTIKERAESGRNTLIMILSTNNGKLDENGKKLLNELLELSPNDYWLNFIKKKSYE